MTLPASRCHQPHRRELASCTNPTRPAPVCGKIVCSCRRQPQHLRTTNTTTTPPPPAMRLLKLAVAASAACTHHMAQGIAATLPASGRTDDDVLAGEPVLNCDLNGDKFVCSYTYPPAQPAGTPRSRSSRVGRPSDDVQQCCVSTMPMVPQALDNCGGSRPVGLPFAGRSPVLAQRGMAATSQPLSTQAALDVLKLGGNAVDAAIAANAMEGVVEPMMNGLGGDLMAMVYDPKTGKLQGINSSGRASKTLSYNQMKQLLTSSSEKEESDEEDDEERAAKEAEEEEGPDGATGGGDGRGQLFIPTKGPLSVSVPGAAAGWCYLFDRFGSGNVTLAQVLAPAIHYATEGFPVSEVIAAEWAASVLDANSSDITSHGRFPHAADGFLATFTVPADGENGADSTTAAGARRAPRAGEVFRNPDLAKTLSAIAVGGCGAFYNGTVAQAVAAFASTGGTKLTADDFASHVSEWVDPVNTTYRGNYTVFELPPNPQGIAALQQLNILEGFDLAAMGHNSADYLHVHVESKKLAFADRAKYYADPDFVKVPVDWLISKGYAAERRKLINMSHAAQEVDAGTPNDHSLKSTGDTIYLTTADKDGMMVSLIQSNYEGFGSGLVVPGTGFALQDRGALFSMDPAAADVYAPGKRPFHTIIPGHVFKNGKPWLSFGVMGGNMQPQGHSQIISNIVDFDMNVQEAGDAARYYHSGSSQPTGQIMHDGGIVQLEAGVCSAVAADLQGRGHTVVRGGNGGGYQAIMRVEAADAARDGFVYHGASEMRKDGQAAGY